MRKHSRLETSERSDPFDAGELTLCKSLNVGWFESSQAGIASGVINQAHRLGSSLRAECSTATPGRP